MPREYEVLRYKAPPQSVSVLPPSGSPDSTFIADSNAQLHLIAQFEAPPVSPVVTTMTLKVNAPNTIVYPFPSNVAVFSIQNNGTKNLLYWWNYLPAVPLTNYNILTPGSYRAYATNPAGLFAAPSAGETNPSITFEYWLKATPV